MDTKIVRDTSEYREALYWAEGTSPTKGKRAIDDLVKVSFKAGMKEGIGLFAWWKDGTQYVGTCGTTLAEALKSEGIE